MKTKHSIVTLFLIIVGVACGLAQSKNLHIPRSSDDGELSFWYTYDTAFFNRIGLRHLHHSPYPYHFRIRAESSTLDIWKTNDGILNAKAVIWTKEYTPENEEPTNRIFHLETPLDSVTADKIFRLIQSSGIDTLRDQGEIPGWQQGLDGVEYIIEQTDRNDYYFKSYWTPSAQDSLKEAQLVQSFVDNAFFLANETALLMEFASKIPFESYYNDPSRLAIRVLTDAERKLYKRERDSWRNQQRKNQQ